MNGPSFCGFVGMALLTFSSTLSLSPKKMAATPLCDCVACKCDPCICGPQAAAPATVNTIPIVPPEVVDVNLLTFDNGSITAPQPAAEPPPGLIVPVIQAPPVKPAVQAPKAPAGHYETYQSCGRGGCSTYSVWVADSPAGQSRYVQPVSQGNYGSCSNGSCGQRRGLFGRRR